MGKTQARCSGGRWNEVVMGMWVCRKREKLMSLGGMGVGQREGREGGKELRQVDSRLGS